MLRFQPKLFLLGSFSPPLSAAGNATTQPHMTSAKEEKKMQELPWRGLNKWFTREKNAKIYKTSMTHSSCERWYCLISAWFINVILMRESKTGKKTKKKKNTVGPSLQSAIKLLPEQRCGSRPWPPRITSNWQPLKLFLLISHFQIRILIHTMKN